MNNRHLIPAAAVALVLALAGAVVAETNDLWIHLQVEEDSGATRVRVNLPLGVMESLLPMIAEDPYHRGQLHLDGLSVELDRAELQSLVAELRKTPAGTSFVSVESPAETVHVYRRGDDLLIEATEHQGDQQQVEIRVPFAVVEALLSGAGEELDFWAGIRALADQGEGELVAVNGRHEQVRVWVDRRAESR